MGHLLTTGRSLGSVPTATEPLEPERQEVRTAGWRGLQERRERDRHHADAPQPLPLPGCYGQSGPSLCPPL